MIDIRPRNIIKPVLVVAIASTQAFAQSADSSWSVPMRLPGFPEGHALQYASVASDGTRIFLAANALPTRGGEQVARRAMVLLQLPGRVIDVPTGDFLFVHPKIVFARKRLHLFWAEPASNSPVVLGWPATLGSVWHAELIGATWSTPHRLLSEQNVAWGSANGALAVDDSGDIHIVVPTAITNADQPLTYLRSRGTTWERRPIGAWAAYASIGLVGTNTIAVAYAAADSSISSDRNSLFVVTSPDRGQSWRHRVLVRRGGKERAVHYPRMLSIGSRLTLVWVQQSQDGSPSSAIHVAHSIDSGATWKDSSSTSQYEGEVDFTADATPCGPVVLIDQLTTMHSRLMEVEFSTSQIRERPFFRDFAISASPTISFVGGHLLTAWRSARNRGDPMVSWMSTKAACASSRR